MTGRYPPPIFFLAVSAAAGVALEDRIDLRLSVILIALASIAAGAAIGLWRSNRAPVSVPYLLFFMMGMLTAAYAEERIESGPLYEAALRGSKVKAVGTIAREPSEAKRGALIELAVEEVEVGGKSISTSETARVLVSPSHPSLKSGTRIAVEGRASPAGGRDPTWREYFLHKGVAAQISSSPGQIEIVSERGDRLKRFIGDVRGELKKSAYRSLPRETAGLLLGLILGDPRAVDREIQDDFRATGLSHVVAASGMNVMFVVGALWPLLRLARAPVAVQAVAIIAGIWFYAFLAEGSPSILRASVMASAVIAAWSMGRRKDPVAALSFAALALLAVNPFSIFDIGFQLSFAASLALIWLTPVVAEKFDRLPNGVSVPVASCLAAQMGTMPIIAAHFGQLSIVSLPANLFVVPAAAPAVVLGILAGCSDFLSPGLSSLIYGVAGAFADLMIFGARIFASFPAASVAAPKPGALEIFAFYLVLFISMAFLSRWRGRFSAFHLLLLIVMPIAFAVGWQVHISKPPSKVEVSFLDIGQGDAILFREPGGATALVDAGPDAALISRRLLSKGIRKLDLAVITHAHSDHSAGFRGVLRSARVGRMLVPPDMGSGRDLKGVIDDARSRGTDIEVAEEGKVYALGAISFEVLRAKRVKDENDSSIVLKMASGEFSLLLPGDSEEEAERELTADGGLRSTALKVPHHGGATAADLGFLRAVSPKVSVISVGKGNPYGLPSKTAIARLREVGSAVFRTDLSGDVTISTDGKIMEVAVER